MRKIFYAEDACITFLLISEFEFKNEKICIQFPTKIIIIPN